MENLRKSEFLYWFRDTPKRPLATDIEWAKVRFQSKFGYSASRILVNQKEEADFKDFGLEVQVNKGIQEGYFGIW